MAIAWFCYNESGDVIHVHEQDETGLPKEVHVNACTKGRAAHRAEEITLEALPGRLADLTKRGLINQPDADKMYSKFSEKELAHRAIAEQKRLEVQGRVR